VSCTAPYSLVPDPQKLFKFPEIVSRPCFGVGWFICSRIRKRRKARVKSVTLKLYGVRKSRSFGVVHFFFKFEAKKFSFFGVFLPGRAKANEAGAEKVVKV